MTAEWCERRLGDIAEIYDGPHATPAKKETGPIFLGISNLVDGRIDLSSTEHLSEKDFEKWTRRVTPKANDIVFSYETRIGEAALIPSGLRCCLGRRMGLLRPRCGKVDARLLLYTYLGPEFQQTLQSQTIHGSTVDRIPLINMPDFPIRIPVALEQQKAIAHVLGTLDDKIELNRRMNETLEAMARAIFKAWFVDFDPVHAKAEGRQPFGMDAETASVFPDSFQDSALGKIPKGWQVKNIGSCFSYVIGGDWGQEEQSVKFPVQVAVIRGTDFARIRSCDDEPIPRRFITQERFRARKLVCGDLLLEISGGSTDQPTGRSLLVTDGIIDRLLGRVVPASFCRLIRPAGEAQSYFLALYLKDLYEKGGTWNYQNQSTGISNFQFEYFSTHELLAYPANNTIWDCFARRVRPLYAKIDQDQSETRTLTALRDTLLPKLISGELRLKDGQVTTESLA